MRCEKKVMIILDKPVPFADAISFDNDVGFK